MDQICGPMFDGFPVFLDFLNPGTRRGDHSLEFGNVASAHMIFQKQFILIQAVAQGNESKPKRNAHTQTRQTKAGKTKTRRTQIGNVGPPLAQEGYFIDIKKRFPLTVRRLICG